MKTTLTILDITIRVITGIIIIVGLIAAYHSI